MSEKACREIKETFPDWWPNLHRLSPEEAAEEGRENVVIFGCRVEGVRLTAGVSDHGARGYDVVLTTVGTHWGGVTGPRFPMQQHESSATNAADAFREMLLKAASNLRSYASRLLSIQDQESARKLATALVEIANKKTLR